MEMGSRGQAFVFTFESQRQVERVDQVILINFALNFALLPVAHFRTPHVVHFDLGLENNNTKWEQKSDPENCQRKKWRIWVKGRRPR